MKITKAVIPAAGLGTRFLPQTKAMPKEMLPLIDKPIIQYVVEEAVAAGITDIIIVTGPHKRSIEDHFDHHSELENHLLQSGKTDMADELRRIADMANFIYVRQKGLAGTGTPVLNAAHLLGDEPFLVLFGDDFFVNGPPRSQQLVEEFEQLGSSVIALTPIDPRDTHEGNLPFAVPAITRQLREDLFELSGLVEKPRPQAAPSQYASVSGYLLTPEVIGILQRQKPQPNGELYLADAIDTLARRSKLYGRVIKGRWHDTGNKAKYLEAIADVALADSELGPDFRRYLKRKLGQI
ncbi:MAG TPA: UTP--glucose-1-phosphate uridylyltransferase [Candidatus Saccharimonadales bacterium]|nr:UTP--glucose-1-phosphate uridylyltransferase [Candidatus Saccharimonadales bacterium]